MFWNNYAWGFRSYEEAESILLEDIANGLLTEVDTRIISYKTTEGKTRYMIQEMT